jgi:hypothetical protein
MKSSCRKKARKARRKFPNGKCRRLTFRANGLEQKSVDSVFKDYFLKKGFRDFFFRRLPGQRFPLEK